MMLKYALLAGAMTISAAAVAQDRPAADPSQAKPAAVAGRQPLAESSPAPATDPVAPSETMAQAAPAPTPEQADPASPSPQQAATQPATDDSQVAAVVDKEFPSYDVNKDGNLSQAEFATWMVALKKASDPSTTADSPATKSWVGSAFAQADTDKSKSVSKTELEGFLTPRQS